MSLCENCGKLLEVDYNEANPQDEAVCTRCGAEHWVTWSSGEIPVETTTLKRPRLGADSDQ